MAAKSATVILLVPKMGQFVTLTTDSVSAKQVQLVELVAAVRKAITAHHLMGANLVIAQKTVPGQHCSTGVTRITGNASAGITLQVNCVTDVKMDIMVWTKTRLTVVQYVPVIQREP